MNNWDFVVIMGQGRSGSTLLLRMLNAVPGVRIAGENEKALNHLKALVQCFEIATTRHDTEFYRLAWSLPCPLELIRQKVSGFVSDLYNPHGQYKLAGFKEIRYGLTGYESLCDDIRFMRQILPRLKIVFNTRRTEDAIKSAWWAEKPVDSRRVLETSRSSFERYHREHPEFTFPLPYEELRHGSKCLGAMFDFLGLEFTDAAQRELDRRLR
jgi:hypothetical protein